MSSKLIFTASLLTALYGSTLASVCAHEGVILAPNSRPEAANPTFYHPATSLSFQKYATPLSDATEAEMVALEYLGSYNTDSHGATWVLSEEGDGLARLTQPYGKYFSAENENPQPSEETYTYNQVVFNNAIQQVRGNATLQQDAREWADASKAAAKQLMGIGPASDDGDVSSVVANTGLERRLHRCGSSRCHSQRTCISTGGRYCRICQQFTCYYSALPDGC